MVTPVVAVKQNAVEGMIIRSKVQYPDFDFKGGEWSTREKENGVH